MRKKIQKKTKWTTSRKIFNGTSRTRTIFLKIKRFGRNVATIQASHQYLINLFINKQKPFVATQNKKAISQKLEYILGSNTQSPNNFQDGLKSFFDFFKIKEVEVSVSDNGTFGYINHFTKNLSIEDFLAYKGSFSLYVAQFPLYQKLEYDNQVNDAPQRFPTSNSTKKFVRNYNFSKKKELFDLFENCLPNFINERLHEIEYINIWINLTKNKSLLHFDLYDNYLYVICGRKTVYLQPPDSNLVQNKSIFEDGYHQVTIQIPPDNFTPKKTKLNIQKFLLEHKSLKKVVQTKGEVLRIPEGWYHYIVSEPQSIAMNFWFSSIFQKYKGLENIVTKKLVFGKVDQFLKKEVFLANHFTKGSCRILNLLESVPDIHLRKFILDMVQRKKLDFDKLLLDKTDLKSTMILELLTQRLESLDRKIFMSDLVSSGSTNLKFFEVEDKNQFYQKFSEVFDESKAKQVSELKFGLRKKIMKYLLNKLVSTTNI